MIRDKAIRVTKAMDKLAEGEFGKSYTLKTTFWNDRDFRIVAYNSKAVDGPGKRFIELWYQETKVPDGECWKVRTEQEEGVPRGEARQSQIGATEAIDLPEIDE